MPRRDGVRPIARSARTGACLGAAAVCSVLLALPGCVTLPDADQLIASAQSGIVRIDGAECATRGLASEQDFSHGAAIDFK